MEEEYNGELPKHVVSQLQEHSAGGFILFRIGPEGDIISDMKFDSEVFYLALVKKATSTLMALNSIDNTQALRALSGDYDFESFAQELKDAENELDEDENDSEEEDYDDEEDEDEG